MTRRRAALLGVAAAGAVIVTARARARAKARPAALATDAVYTADPRLWVPLHPVAIAVAAWLFVRTQLRQTVLSGGFGDVLNGIGGFFSGIVTTVIGDIASAVAHAISWTLSLVGGWIADAYTHFTELIGDIPGAFVSVVDFVDGLYELALGYVDTRFEQLFDGLSTTLSTVLSGANWLRDWITTIATNLVDLALSATGDFVEWLWENIINPIYSAIAAVTDGVAALVAQLVSDALDVAGQVGGWLYSLIVGIAQSIVNDAFAVFSDLFDVVRGAWDFLVWVALHPLDWFEQLASSILDLSGETVLHALEGAITSNESGVEDLLDRLFG